MGWDRSVPTSTAWAPHCYLQLMRRSSLEWRMSSGAFYHLNLAWLGSDPSRGPDPNAARSVPCVHP